VIVVIRVGIVGCGGISYEHVRRLSLLEEGEAKLVGLCDIILERAERLMNYANKFRNITPEPLTKEHLFTDYSKMLDNLDLDAVIVCTPHTLHYEHVMEALKRSLHVLVEKPMAITVKEAVEMAMEAKKRGLTLAIGYQRHFQPQYVYARNLILSGKVGDPHFIVGWLVQNLLIADRFYLNPKLSGGGQLKASGTHLVDIVLWVTNTEPVRVKAMMDRCGTEVDIYVGMVVELSNGAIASIAISGGAPGLTTAVDEELRVWCSRGGVFVIGDRVYVQNEEGDITLVDRGKLPKVSPNPDVNFIRAIAGKEECMVPAECGVRATKLEEMAYVDVGKPIPNKLRR